MTTASKTANSNKSSSSMNAAQQIEEATQNFTKAAQDALDRMAKMSKEHTEKMYPNTLQGYDQFASEGKESLDAFAKSTALCAKGWEQVSNAMLSWSQEMMENNVSATKALMGCKNWKEMAELQSDLCKTNMDRAMAEANKIAEMSMKVANEAARPLQNRMNKAVDSMMKKAA